jgi:hypothetical protein
MKIETKFDIGQEVFWHDVKNDRALQQFVNSIKAEVYESFNGGLGISVIYHLVPAQIWVSDFHLLATREEAEREVEKWKKL